MSNKTEDKRMKPAAKRALEPKLRFPEFRDAGPWVNKKLDEIVVVINEKAGSRKFTLMSVSSGVGLVSQIEKFGREIAGAQYKNYEVIRKNDFAYNKSATKEFPEGFIAMYSGEDPGAVPSSIFTCFRVDDKQQVHPPCLSYLFSQNLHGKWLKKYITVGARAHGSLNIDNNDLLSMPVPLPSGETSLDEQQRIADCLSSIDTLITFQAKKIDTLKAHKKGLMQQLFPAEGETLPKLRFPEFRETGEWEERPLGEVFSFKTTNSYSRDMLNYEKGSVKNLHYGDIHTKFSTLFDIEVEDVPFINLSVSLEKIKPDSYCVEGDIVFADASEDLDDIGKCIEIVNLNNEKLLSGLHTLLARQREEKLKIGFGAYLFNSNKVRAQIKKESQGAKVLGISAGRLAGIQISFPSDKKEQQKIADCLSSIDELITFEAKKFDTLKSHKKGLMQQLFPALDEVQG